MLLWKQMFRLLSSSLLQWLVQKLTRVTYIHTIEPGKRGGRKKERLSYVDLTYTFSSWVLLVFVCVPVPSDPVLLEMTVQELESDLKDAVERICTLENQVQQLTYQWNFVQQQLQSMQRCQLPPIHQHQPPSLQPSWGWDYTGGHTSRSDMTASWENYPTYEPSPQSQHPHVDVQNIPQPVLIKERPTTTYLPSSVIQKRNLKTPEEVIRKYPKLQCESYAGKLAVKLSREAFFGEDVLVRCTVNGFRELPALPLHELNELKKTMLKQFPKYWNSVQEFEALWITCSDAIGQAAKALRSKGA